MDKNATRVKKKREEKKNKKAFTEILGDPFLELDGVYNTLQRRSIGSIDGKLDSIAERVDPSKPSISDFFCDVQNILREVLEPEWISSFCFIYLQGHTSDALSKQLRKHIEQRVGKLFRVRGLSPIQRYFTVIK